MNIVRDPRNFIASLLLIIASFGANGDPQNDETKINIAVYEIKTLATNIDKETAKLMNVEERLKSEMKQMSDRMDSAIKNIQSSLKLEMHGLSERIDTKIEKFVQSSVSSQNDKSLAISNEVLSEVGSVRTELTNVEERLHSKMNDSLDSAIEKLKPEFLSVRTELDNVGLLSFQTIDNVQVTLE